MLLPEHSHCKYCGDPIKEGLEYCNDECKNSFNAEAAAEKRKDYKFYAIIAISLIAILAVGAIIKFLK